jgi:hypothetical protein
VLNDAVMATLDAHLGANEPVVAPGALEEAGAAASGTEVEDRIRQILDLEIRPAVMQDGGDITLDRFENGVVYLHMRGSCSGCPVLDDDPEDGDREPAREVVPRWSRSFRSSGSGRGRPPLVRRQVKAAEVRRELLPEQSPELLRELHLLTRDGDLNADALRKLKQVNHLVGCFGPRWTTCSGASAGRWWWMPEAGTHTWASSSTSCSSRGRRRGSWSRSRHVRS